MQQSATAKVQRELEAKFIEESPSIVLTPDMKNRSKIGDIQAEEEQKESTQQISLMNSGQTDFNGYTNSNHEQFFNEIMIKSQSDTSRREKRLKQNRESALRLRVRRKENYCSLEEQTEALQQEKLELSKEIEDKQSKLLEAMKESIELRRRINECLNKQREMLIEAFKLNDGYEKVGELSRRISDLFCTDQSQNININNNSISLFINEIDKSKIPYINTVANLLFCVQPEPFQLYSDTNNKASPQNSNNYQNQNFTKIPPNQVSTVKTTPITVLKNSVSNSFKPNTTIH